MFRQGMFFIDPSQDTPESISRKRAAIRELSGGFGSAQNVPEGVGDLFRGIAIGAKERGLARAERAGMESASKIFGSILDGAFANDPSAPNNVPAQSALPNMSSGDSEPVNWDGADLRSGIAATAQSLGIDPVDLATAISYETAGTFDPTKRGPTTQWGRHKGLIQFGEPQAKKYGVNWEDPVGSQLGPDGAVAKYLRDTGVQPGMGLLDIYSAINAGGVGRYNRTDANNGGAPGTVRDKVEKQMAGHRAKAQKLFADWQGGASSAQAPVQVASLDPSSGVSQAMAYAPQPTRQPELTTQNAAPQGMAAPRPQQAPAQMAEAQQQGGGLSTRELIEAAQNPWLSAGQRQVVNMLLEQRMQQQDPRYQLETQRLRQQLQTGAPDYISPADQQRIELDRQRFGLDERRLEADMNRPVSIGGALVNPQTGQPVYQAPREPMTVNPGQFVIDPQTGRSIFEAPAEPGYNVLSPQEVQSLGLPAGAYQRSPKGEIKPIGGGGTSLSVDSDGNVTFNQGGTSSAGRDVGTMGKELSKADRAMLDQARDASTNAENLDSLATQLETVIGNVGYTGPGGNLYGAIDDALGILPGDSGARGAFRSLGMEAQLTFTEKTKGAITDREMGMFREAVPNLSQTPEGNKEIIKVMRAGAQRTKQRADFYERYMAQNGSLQGAQSSWQKFIEANPLISSQEGRFSLNSPADPSAFLDPNYTPSKSGGGRQGQGSPSIDDLLKQYGGN